MALRHTARLKHLTLGRVRYTLLRSDIVLMLLVPNFVIGFFALPWASVVLWQARSLTGGVASDPQVAEARRRHHRRLVIGTITAMLVVASVVIAIPNGVPFDGRDDPKCPS